jgi:hypothetical protein
MIACGTRESAVLGIGCGLRRGELCAESERDADLAETLAALKAEQEVASKTLRPALAALLQR